MNLDTSMFGWLKSAGYIIACTYAWIDEKGINAYVMSVLLCFMALDIILGWIKASIIKELDNPTSKKAKKGILSKSIMFAIPAISGLIWGAFDKEGAIRIVNLQLMALMVAEGYSNIANSYTIYTGEVLSEFDAVTYVFKKTAQKIRGLLGRVYR